MFNKKRGKGKGGNSGDDECRVCRGRGGYKSRDSHTGKIIKHPCGLCKKLPN